MEKDPPRRLNVLTEKLEKEVWADVDCLSCANCCKTIDPAVVACIETLLQKNISIKKVSSKSKGCVWRSPSFGPAKAG